MPQLYSRNECLTSLVQKAVISLLLVQHLHNIFIGGMIFITHLFKFYRGLLIIKGFTCFE